MLGTVGEPINPEAWRWYFDVVGEGRCSIVDTYWQTETGGHVLTGLAGANDMKPGSASLPFFGIEPVLVDPDGNELEGNPQSGLLCLARSWPGMMRTVYGDHERFISTYFIQYPGKYFTGDGSFRDHDGYYWLTGTGRRRAERFRAPVWGRRRSRARWWVTPAAPRRRLSVTRTRFKGEGIYAYVLLKDGFDPGPDLAGELKRQVQGGDQSDCDAGQDSVRRWSA